MTFRPIPRLSRYGNFFIAFQLVGNVFDRRMQQVFSVPRTRGCPVVIEEFDIICQVRTKFPIFHHGNVQDAACRHIPVVIGTYGKRSSNLVIVNSEIFGTVRHALINRGRSLHDTYRCQGRCRNARHECRHN